MKPTRFLLYLFAIPFTAAFVVACLETDPWHREPASGSLAADRRRIDAATRASALADIPLLLDNLRAHFLDDACHYGDGLLEQGRGDLERSAQDARGLAGRPF